MKRFLLLALSCLVIVVMVTFSSKVARASGGGGGLNGIAALSDDNVWAVGQNAITFQVLIKHWDGTVWQIVPTPGIPGAQSSRLQGIAAISANDVWAVGSIDPLADLIEHWNGRTWSIVSNRGGQGDFLNGITALSKNNAWAVGTFFDSSSTEHVLIKHWDGHTWSTVRTADPGPQNNTLLAVAATSAQDVWAVGGFTDAKLANQGLVEHWDGHSWHLMTRLNPAGSNNATLSGVSALSPKNVWAVGAATDSSNHFSTWIEHWDGHSWQRVSSPNYPNADDSILNVVAAVPNDEDVWAVGIAFTSRSDLIEAWNGSTWNLVPNPTS
ncbi:MAG: hypothetical protein NVS4B12_27320 [Ktedonobacteraceae bacterium]